MPKFQSLYNTDLTREEIENTPKAGPSLSPTSQFSRPTPAGPLNFTRAEIPLTAEDRLAAESERLLKEFPDKNVSEETAFRAKQFLDASKPREELTTDQAVMQYDILDRSLRSYVEKNRAQNLPHFPTETAKLNVTRNQQFANLYTKDPADYLDEDQLKEYQFKKSRSTDPEAYHARAANRAYLEGINGAPISDDKYDFARDQFARLNFGLEDDTSDKALFQAIKSRHDSHAQAGELVKKRGNELYQRGLEGATRKELESMSFQKHAENMGIPEEYLTRSGVQLESAFRQGQADRRDAMPIVKGIVQGFALRRGRDINQDQSTTWGDEVFTSVGQAVDALADYNEAKRGRVLHLVSQELARLPEIPDDNSLTERALLEAIQGATGLRDGMGRWLEMLNEYDIELTKNTAQAIGSVGADYLGENEEAKKKRDVRIQLGQALSGQLSSIEMWNPTPGFFDNPFEKLVLGGSRQIPNMVTVFAGLPGLTALGASMAGDSYGQQRLDSPDGDKGKQALLGTLSGGAQAATEVFLTKAGLKLVGGKVPGLAALFTRAGITNPLARSAIAFPLGALGATAVEVTEEIVQEATDNILTDIARELSALDSDTDWGEFLTSWTTRNRKTEEVLYSIVPFAFLGAGAVTSFRHFQHGEFLQRANPIMKSMGIPSDKIAEINEKSPEEAGQVVQEELGRLDDVGKAAEAGKPASEIAEEGQQRAAVLESVREAAKLARDAGFPLLTEEKNEFTEENQWVLRAPGQKAEVFETEEAAAEALQSWAIDQHQDNLQEINDAVIQDVIEFLTEEGQQAQGTRVVSKNVVMTPERAISQGLASMELMKARANIFALQEGTNGPPTDLRIMARRFAQVSTRGVYRGTVEYYRGADPLNLLEDLAETNWHKAIELGFYDGTELLQHLREVQQITANKYVSDDYEYSEDNQLDLIEGLSKLSVEYALGQVNADNFPAKLKKWLEYMVALAGQMFRHAKSLTPLFSRSKNLMDKIKEGKIDEKFLSQVADSVGLNDAETRHRREQLQAAEAHAQALGDFEEISSSLRGRIPHPQTLLENSDPMHGEVARIHDSMKKLTKRKNKKGQPVVNSVMADNYFLPQGEYVKLDEVRQSLNEDGYNFETPAEMIEALEDSLLYGIKTHATGNFEDAGSNSFSMAGVAPSISSFVEPGFYSQLESVIEGKMGKSATVDQILGMINPAKGSGIKADEIKWSGLEEALPGLAENGKVSKDKLLTYLRENGRIQFRTLQSSKFSNFGRVPAPDSPRESLPPGDNSFLQRYQDYQLKGGTNYLETVLALPSPSMDERLPSRDETYTSPHFSMIPNYVAHMRTNEREDSNGQPGLFIEEIQSDRHQAGRKKGYVGDKQTATEAKGSVSSVDLNTYKPAPIADAPFRKEWPLAMFKRALRAAVSTGKEWIGWTSGDIQNARYPGHNLSDYYDKILPTTVQKYVKKWGGKITQQTLNIPERNVYSPYWYFKYQFTDGVTREWGRFESEQEARDELRRKADEREITIEKWSPPTPTPKSIWHMEITEEMRDSVNAGQSSFSLSPAQDAEGYNTFLGDVSNAIQEWSDVNQAYQSAETREEMEESVGFELQQKGVDFGTEEGEMRYNEAIAAIDYDSTKEALLEASDDAQDKAKDGVQEALEGFLEPMGYEIYSPNTGGSSFYFYISPNFETEEWLNENLPAFEIEDGRAKIRFSDHANTSSLHSAPDVNIQPGESIEPQFNSLFERLPNLTAIIETDPSSDQSSSSVDYRGTHTAPLGDYGGPGHNLSDYYPADIYGPNGARYYGDSMPEDQEAINVIRSMRDKPNAAVKVYRAIPGGIKSKINAGDWVTTVEAYAKVHGEGPLQGNYQIVSKTVRAEEIFTEGNSIYEWGYDPTGNASFSVSPSQDAEYLRLAKKPEKNKEKLRLMVRRAAKLAGAAPGRWFQIKSGELVTRDDAGNVIPLSQRFDQSSDQISFSVGSSTIIPNEQTRAYPTKDGGVVGPASFSITAHHGTPHKVGRFSTENIGTGEGAQAYGWGLYFAEDKKVAESYKKSVTDRVVDEFGVTWSDGEGGFISNSEFESRVLQVARWLPYVKEIRESLMDGSFSELKKTKRDSAWTAALSEAEKYSLVSGSLYTVELNIEQDVLLDWDKPLSEQSELVRDVLSKTGYTSEDTGYFEDDGKEIYTKFGGSFDFMGAKFSGKPKQASEALAAAGIKGIRYLDGDSRVDGEGTSNYVIFDDADITITEENGQVVDTSSSFSMSGMAEGSNPIKDRKGEDQGKPLTETEIREQIEDEPGTLADIKIDDDLFSQDSDDSFSVASNVPIIKRSSLKGKKKFVYFSDWTRVGVYTGLHAGSGIAIDLQGGPSFPYIDGHKKKGKAGWAFTTEGMFTRFQSRVNQTDGIGLTTLYGKDNLRANPTFLKAYVEELKYAVKAKLISKAKMLEALNKARVQVLGLSSKRKNKKTGKVKVVYTISRDGKTHKDFSKDWTSIAQFNRAMKGATFEVRAAMFSTSPKEITRNKVTKKVPGEFSGGRLANKTNVKAGMPDVIEMINLFADPMFDGAEYGTIVGAIQFEKGQTSSVKAQDIGAEKHLSYPVITKGKGLGLFDSFIHANKVVANPGNKSGFQLTRSSETSMAPASFSLSAPGIERLEAAVLAKLNKGPEERVDYASKLIDRLHGLRQKTILAPNSDEGERIKENLREAQAIFTALPVEARPKASFPIGAIADAKTEKARLTLFEKMIDSADKALEVYLQKQYLESLTKLFDLAKPDLRQNKSLRTRLSPNAQRLATAAFEVSVMSPEEVINGLQSIQTTINNFTSLRDQAAIDGDKEAIKKHSDTLHDAERYQRMLNTFGAMPYQSSYELAEALDNLRHIYAQGKFERDIIDDRRRQDLDGMRESVLPDLGGRPASDEWQRNTAKEGFFSRMGAFAMGSLSYHQIMEKFFPTSDAARQFQKRIRTADRDVTRARINARERFEAHLRKRWGKGKLGQAKILAELSERKELPNKIREWKNTEKVSIDPELAKKILDGTTTISWSDDPIALQSLRQALADFNLKRLRDQSRAEKVRFKRVISRAPARPLVISPLETVYILQLAGQEQYLPALDRYGYTEGVIDALRQGLPDEARDIADFLANEYAGEYDRLNPVYRTLFHMDMPRVKNYAPGSFEHMFHTTTPDPDGTEAAPVNALSAGFTKARQHHIARPQQRNALEVFWNHHEQTEYFIAWAEVSRDMGAVFKTPDVRRALEAKYGKKVATNFFNWIDGLATDFRKPTNEEQSMREFVNNAQASLSAIGLAVNVGSLLKQFSAGTGMMMEMPTNQAVAGMYRAITNPSSYKNVWESDTIQQRIKQGMSPEDRAILEASNAKPSTIMALLEAGRYPLGLVDGIFTTLSAMVAYNYHLKEADKAGLSPEKAEAHAMEVMDRVVVRTAQPATAQDKSLIENTSKGFSKFLLIFRSDPRQKMALGMEAVEQFSKGKMGKLELGRRFIWGWVVYGILAQIATDLWHAISREEDEELSLDDYIYAGIAGPLTGLPLLGSIVDTGLRNAINALGGDLQIFTNSTNPLDKAAFDMFRGRTLKKLTDDTDDDAGEIMKAILSDSRAWAQVLGIFAKATAIVPVTARAVRDAYGMIENALPDSPEDEQGRILDQFLEESKEASDEASDRKEILLEELQGMDESAQKDRLQELDKTLARSLMKSLSDATLTENEKKLRRIPTKERHKAIQAILKTLAPADRGAYLQRLREVKILTGMVERMMQ